jgi:DNA-binding SARP family transcriptional activator
LLALERRIAADLALGRHSELVPELEALVAEHPLREGLRAQLMLALYRADRQAEALDPFLPVWAIAHDDEPLPPLVVACAVALDIDPHGPLLRSPERELVTIAPHHDRAENGELHDA